MKLDWKITIELTQEQTAIIQKALFYSHCAKSTRDNHELSDIEKKEAGKIEDNIQDFWESF